MRKLRGFTLIEIVVVLAIVSLLVAMAAMATRAITMQQRISATNTRLAGVDAALLQFVMVQKRLPCPADGSIASGGAGAGVEGARTSTGCSGNEVNGVVPWTTLGISETDATDGWDRRLTYRIPTALAADSAMDMSGCDPAGSAGPAGGPCATGCVAATVTNCTTPSNFLSGKGLTVQNIGGAPVMSPGGTPPTGAAYVVISHGESGGGGFLNSGTVATSTAPAPGDGAEEQKNYANVPLGTYAYYVDDAYMAGATHFDDVLSHPTVLAVINKAALGPRSH